MEFDYVGTNIELTFGQAFSNTSCNVEPPSKITETSTLEGSLLETGSYTDSTTYFSNIPTSDGYTTENWNFESFDEHSIQNLNEALQSSVSYSSYVLPIQEKKQTFELSKENNLFNTQIPANNCLQPEIELHGWNQKYLKLIDLYFSSPSKDQIPQQMQTLANDFANAVLYYAKIIINELKSDSKTIPKIDAGGVIGGVKYKIDGILFKLAIPTDSDKSKEEFYAKISGHELKSLESIIGCNVADLYFPMLAVVDYKGYRVIGVSTLPIGMHTLVSGSSNSGRVIKSPEKKEEKKLQQICDGLNLLPHEVIETNLHKSKVTVYGPFDLEGHIGIDNRFYLLDFSRLFPPDKIRTDPLSKEENETLSKSPDIQHKSNFQKFSHLYKLFRPEFVKTLKTPLCSDTYSCILDDSATHSSANAFAHESLIKRIIDFSSKEEHRQPLFIDLPTPKNMIEILHGEGINLRYSGFLHHLFIQTGLESSHWVKFLKVEMVARAIKWLIRDLLRSSAINSELNLVLQELNNLLFSYNNRNYWEEKIFPSLILKYHYLPSNFPKTDYLEGIFSFFNDNHLNVKTLLDRIFDLVGIKVKRDYNVERSLEPSDFHEEIIALVKTPDYVKLLR